MSKGASKWPGPEESKMTQSTGTQGKSHGALGTDVPLPTDQKCHFTYCLPFHFPPWCVRACVRACVQAGVCVCVCIHASEHDRVV